MSKAKRPVPPLLDDRPAIIKHADPTCIRTWRFDAAPAEIQGMVPEGGEPLWLMLVPPVLADEALPWLDYLDGFRNPDFVREHGHVLVVGRR